MCDEYKKDYLNADIIDLKENLVTIEALFNLYVILI